MAFDFDAIKNAGAPYQRRRQALEQEHARNTAAAQASTPAPPRSAAPFVISTLKTCVCGARPRYAFEEHVKWCKAAQLMRSADPPPVTAEEVVIAIEATAPSDLTPEKISAAIEVVKTAVPSDVVHFENLRIPEGCEAIDVKRVCQKCKRVFKTHVPYFHAKNCKGKG